MGRKMKKSRILFAFAILSISMSSGVRGFDFTSLKGLFSVEKHVPIPFLSDLESRKQQLEKLQYKQALVAKQATEQHKIISGRLQSVGLQIATVQKNLQARAKNDRDGAEKKLSLLRERKQVIVRLQELWKEISRVVEGHVKLIKDFIGELEGEGTSKEMQLIYSWKNLEETKSKIDELVNKTASETAKKGALQKSLFAAKDEQEDVKKRIAAQRSDNDKIIAQFSEGAGNKEGVLLEELKLKAKLGEYQQLYLQAKADFLEQNIEKLSLEIRRKEDEIELYRHRKVRHSKKLHHIQQNLVLDPFDVTRAENEVKVVTRQVSDEKNKIAFERGIKKDSLTKVNEELGLLDKKLEALKEGSKVDTVEYHMINTLHHRLGSRQVLLKKEVDRLDIEKDYVEATLNLKKVKAYIISVLHKLNIGTDKIDEWLEVFKGQRRSAEHAKKVLEDKLNETITELTKVSAEVEVVEAKKRDIKKHKETIFKTSRQHFYEVLDVFKETEATLRTHRFVIEKCFSRISELIFRQEEIMSQQGFIINYLESRRMVDNILRRSSRAISMERFVRSLYDAEKFLKDFFWETPRVFSPFAFFVFLKQETFYGFLGILLFLALFFLFFMLLRTVFVYGRERLVKVAKRCSTRFSCAMKNILLCCVEFVLEHYRLLFTWLFLYIHVVFEVTYLDFSMQKATSAYFTSLFYLVSIFIGIYLSHHLLFRIKKLNEKLQYLIFSEETQSKFVALVGTIFYSGLILLGFRQGFLSYRLVESVFPEVLLAAYSLIVVVVILLFFNKEEFLKLISSKQPFFLWMRKKIDKGYYPVFVFFVGLLILSNPYVGYSNLAWYLAFAIPASLLIVNGLFRLHYYVRKYSLGFFVIEEEENVIDKFEHAKTFYGFFIIASFLFFTAIAFVAVARIWGFEGCTLGSIWQFLSKEWVLSVGVNETLGFVDLFKLIMFVVMGFVSSSLLDKFALSRLFAIFRPEPGMQNTIARLLHYLIIIVAATLGFAAINMAQYAALLMTGLLVGIGFGLKDQIADFFAGFMVLIERPLEIGHFVEIGDLRGTVKKIAARATTIRTARNFYVIVPNRELISKPIVNWGQGRHAVGCELFVVVDYHSDPAMVREVLRKAIQSCPSILKVPSIVCRLFDFEESGMRFYARAFISARKVQEMWEIESELRILVFEAFKKNQIIIPYPQRVLHFATQEQKGDDSFQSPIQVTFDGNKDPISKE
jgi:small-conductance mechanosensitive channel